MAFVHGKSTAFKVDDSGGTLRDISAFLTDVQFPRQIDMAETSTFGNSYKTFLQGLANATISITGKYDSTTTTGPDAVLNSLVGAAGTASFEYGPEGSATGKVKYSGECQLSSYEVSSSIGDVVSFTAQFQMASNVTKGTFA